MKYTYILLFVFFACKNVSKEEVKELEIISDEIAESVIPIVEVTNEKENEQQLDPDEYFVSFDDDTPFDVIYLSFHDSEADTYEKAKLDVGNYYLGSDTSSVKFRFSVNEDNLITGIYHDDDYRYEEGEYDYEGEEEESREVKYQQIEIVDSKAISEIVKSSDSKYVTTYNHVEKSALDRKYNDKGELLQEYMYEYDDDHDELYVEKFKEYNLNDGSYSIKDNSQGAKSNFSKEGKLITVEHFSDYYVDVYDTEGNVVEKKYDAEKYALDQSFKPPLFIFKLITNNTERVIAFKKNMQYALVNNDKVRVLFKTNNDAMINGEIQFLGYYNKPFIIKAKDSQIRSYIYKDKGNIWKGLYYEKDSSFVSTIFYDSNSKKDTLSKYVTKIFFTDQKAGKKIITKYLKKGGYVIENQVANTLEKFNANNIMYASKSLTGDNKSNHTYDDEGKMRTSSYVKDAIKYNDIYEKGVLVKRSYTTVDGEFIEYFKKGELYRREQAYFNDDGVLYLKLFNAKGKLKKDVEMPVVDNKPAPQLIKL